MKTNKKKAARKARNRAKKAAPKVKRTRLTGEDLLTVNERTQSGCRVSWWQC